MSKKPQIITSPIFLENPGNPARAYINRGVIEINREVWAGLSEYERDYILRHENAHIDLKTRSEQWADERAIERGDRKTKNRLYKDYLTVRKLAANDPERLAAAKTKLITLSAERGNKHAKAYLGQTANATGKLDGDGIFVITFYILLLSAGFLTLLV